MCFVRQKRGFGLFFGTCNGGNDAMSTGFLLLQRRERDALLAAGKKHAQIAVAGLFEDDAGAEILMPNTAGLLGHEILG